MIIHYYLYLRQQTIVKKIIIFNILLNQFEMANLKKEIYLKIYFKQIKNLYRNYLLDLELYVKQLRAYNTILILNGVLTIAYLIHFLFITKLPILMVIAAIVIFNGHLVSIVLIIFGSTKISTFNRNYARWYFNTIQHCSTMRLSLFKTMNFFKVKYRIN